jgi:branched-chain amino acid transport system permease protein
VAYIQHLLILVALYGMLAISLAISSGYTKLISLAHAGFCAVGAYTSAILCTRFGFDFWWTLPLAMSISCLMALPVALLSKKTIDDYFIICSMGVSVIITSLLTNLATITNGPLGIVAIPAPILFGRPIQSKGEWLVVLLVAYGALSWIVHNLQRSSFGRLLLAIGEDQIFCESLGKNVNQAKLQSFLLGASLAAIPGCFYAAYTSYIDPSSFGLNDSIMLLSILILAGMGQTRKILPAVCLFVFLPEALRFIGIPGSVAGNLRQALFGLILLLVLWIRSPTTIPKGPTC